MEDELRAAQLREWVYRDPLTGAPMPIVEPAGNALRASRAAFLANPMAVTLLEAMPDLAVVLNSQRQVPIVVKLPAEARAYSARIEALAQARVTMASVGPERTQLVTR